MGEENAQLDPDLPDKSSITWCISGSCLGSGIGITEQKKNINVTMR